MNKLFAFAILIILLSVSVVNSLSIEQGKITEKNILTNQGTILISPSLIEKSADSGTVLNNEIKIDLNSFSNEEFDVEFSADGEIQDWVDFETLNQVIKNGENSFVFSVSVPSDTPSGNYQGVIIMHNDDIEYSAVELILSVQGASNNNLGGGGSSSDGGCRTEWVCTEWDVCQDGKQTRVCSKERSYCYADEKPKEEQNCTIFENLNNEIENDTNGSEQEEQKDTFSLITGAVIGALGKLKTPFVLFFVAILIASAVVVRIIRKRMSK